MYICVYGLKYHCMVTKAIWKMDGWKKEKPAKALFPMDNFILLFFNFREKRSVSLDISTQVSYYILSLKAYKRF